MFSFFGGIDFSGAREPLSNLWSAIGREEQGKLHILDLRPHAYRADLCSFVAENGRCNGEEDERKILWGADLPFSLPREAVAEVCDVGEPASTWMRLLDWIADRPPDEVRDTFSSEARTARAIDLPGSNGPLDNRSYKQAVEGIRWLHSLRAAAEIAVHPQVPDDAASTHLIEVSTAASAQELGLPRRRSPARPGEVRARAAALRTFVTFEDACQEAAAVTLEDAWDATIACITAFLARADLDQPYRTSNLPRQTIALEGWIYRPPAALG